MCKGSCLWCQLEPQHVRLIPKTISPVPYCLLFKMMLKFVCLLWYHFWGRSWANLDPHQVMRSWVWNQNVMEKLYKVSTDHKKWQHSVSICFWDIPKSYLWSSKDSQYEREMHFFPTPQVSSEYTTGDKCCPALYIDISLNTRYTSPLESSTLADPVSHQEQKQKFKDKYPHYRSDSNKANTGTQKKSEDHLWLECHHKWWQPFLNEVPGLWKQNLSRMNINTCCKGLDYNKLVFKKGNYKCQEVV